MPIQNPPTVIEIDNTSPDTSLFNDGTPLTDPNTNNVITQNCGPTTG